jgi:DNA-binding IclR family transcriptional regulator
VQTLCTLHDSIAPVEFTLCIYVKDAMGAIDEARSSDAEDLPGNASRAPAVNRAIGILRVLARGNTPLTLNSIARELGIVPSTCLHVLRALEEEGFVSADPVDKRYSIGLGLVTLARDSLNHGIPTRLIKHELDRIAGEFGVTSIATQIDRDERMVVIALSHGSATFATHFDIGRRFPAYMGATGLCVAAHSGLAPAALKQRFDKVVWGAPPTFEQWLEQVETTRREGVGVDRGQYVPGYTIMSSPILEHGHMTRSLACVAATGQLQPAQFDALKSALKSAGLRLSI